MDALPNTGDLYTRSRRPIMCGMTLGTALLFAACTESPPAGPNRMQAAVTAAADVGTPDPTLLPVASGQAPNVTAYTALNVPGQAAGFSYNDPVTGVKIWKVTSPTVPVANTSAGHDYSEGPNEVSLGWGTDNNTHTILIGAPQGTGNYYLVDFTRGAGFSNYRQLTVQPLRDLCFTFSNLASQPRIAYIMTGSQVLRYNTATMAVENTGSFPLSVNGFGWLQHDKSDVWFAGLLADNTTIWAWNSQAGTYYTHYESWTNEGRLERDGRYIAVSNGNTQFRLWDLSTNTFGPVQYDPSYWLAHNANLRGMWLTSNVYDHNPAHFDSYVPSGDQIVRTRLPNSASAGYGVHHAGNWVQSDAELGGNLNRQWAFVGSWDRSDITVNAAIQQGLGVYRADGSDTRLIAHTYDVNPDYYATEFVMPSPDGKVVIFNSNMQSSGRYDLFVAEMPLGGSPPPPPPPSTQNVVWTNLTNVTANGNSVTKTSGCDGCADAGPISSQTITSGDGYVEFQLSANTANGAAGLSNGSTDNTRDDVDFAIARAGGVAAEVRENGVYKAETPFDGTAVFRVEVVNGVVQYKKNGTVFYTSGKVPTYPLLLDSWIGTVTAAINNAVISGLLN